MLSSVAAACSSKLNLRQKRLRSARPQARLMRLPNGECTTSCMPPASSKKRSSTIVSCVGRQPSAALAARRYSTSCSAAASAMPISSISQRNVRFPSTSPCSRSATSARKRETAADSSSLRPGASPSQNGNAWRRAVGILHAHDAALHAQDAVGRIAELEHVAGHALDGPVLVHGADDLALGLQQHLVVGVVGDGAARGERGEAGAAPAAQQTVHGIVVDQRAAPPAPAAEALGQHADHGRVVLARQLPIGPRPPEQREQLVLAAFARADLGHDLLRQHVERLLGDHEPVQLAAVGAVDERRAFDEVVAREREQPTLRRAADLMSGAADALQEAGDGARRAELADEVDLADVDAELQRGRRHQRLELAPLQAPLGVQPVLLRHAAVVGGDQLLAEPRRELARHPLGHAPRVDEDQRGAVLLG